MNDRFMNGFIAGLIANIPILVLDFIASQLKLDTLDYYKYASILVYGDSKPDLKKSIFPIIVQWMFAGVVGVILNYFLKAVRKKYYYIKSLIYGGIFWFSICCVDIFFKVEDGMKIDFKTSIVHIILSLIWAITAAWIIRWLEKKEKC